MWFIWQGGGIQILNSKEAPEKTFEGVRYHTPKLFYEKRPEADITKAEIVIQCLSKQLPRWVTLSRWSHKGICFPIHSGVLLREFSDGDYIPIFCRQSRFLPRSYPPLTALHTPSELPCLRYQPSVEYQRRFFLLELCSSAFQSHL